MPRFAPGLDLLRIERRRHRGRICAQGLLNRKLALPGLAFLPGAQPLRDQLRREVDQREQLAAQRRVSEIAPTRGVE
jgi:hypothetical protein